MRPNGQPLDEAQLLALIEDQLDASAAARLKSQLADKPELLAQLEQMHADRASMRALPEPTLSRDLLEALEPELARPMLLAPLSGAEYRKRHQRAHRPKFARLALAAAFLLVVMAGVWAATSGLLTRNSETLQDSDRVASRTPGEGVIDQRAMHNGEMLASSAEFDAFDRVTVHHLPPPADVREALAGAQLAMAKPEDADREMADASVASEVTQLAEAPFVLVIETDDLERTMAMLGQPTDPETASVSLVRNITETEVIEYGRMLAARAAASKRLSAPATASADRNPAPVANTPVRAPELLMELPPESLPLGEQIAGDPKRAAAVMDQLRFSNAGAQYALTVPADRVAEALFAINLASGQMTTLRTLEAISVTDEKQPVKAMSLELMWIEQLRSIRTSLEQIDLSQARDVVIPVRIDVRERRPRR